MFDEFQRIYPRQFERAFMIESKNVIFSLDKKQTIHHEEIKRDYEKELRERQEVKDYLLKNKIRQNPVMASFIQKFMNPKVKKVQPYNYENVQIIYFEKKIKLKVI